MIFDGAQLSFEDNVAAAKKCVEYARASGRDVLVEGELGFACGSHCPPTPQKEVNLPFFICIF